MSVGARDLALAITVTAVVGCASMVNGPTQHVEIRSDPPGATATILPARSSFRTPVTVELARRHVHTVFLELDGYCPTTAYLDRVISPVLYLDAPLFVFSLFLGLYATERDKEQYASHRLAPDPLEVELRPIDAERGEEACRAGGRAGRPTPRTASGRAGGPGRARR